MKILVTGGTGDIGRAVSKRLCHRGWELRLIGLEDELPFENVDDIKSDYVKCDIMDFDALKTQMQGCDAVVHLAAIRAPNLAPGREVFRVNVAGTFNVYEAAAQAGVTRVVQASSINAVGCGWSIDEIHPQYFPIDEAHPRVTNDAYSFSKQMVEEVAAYFCRRDGISGTSLRFPWVYNREKHVGEDLERRDTIQRELEKLLHQDEDERRARLEPLQTEALTLRQARGLEVVQTQQPSTPHADPLWPVCAFDRFNYFTFLDDRDAAQAIEKSLSASFEGHHTLFVNDAHNSVRVNSEGLLELFYPEVGERKSAIRDSEALVSIGRARALIGFESEFSMHGI